jgi:hypothetical protein
MIPEVCSLSSTSNQTNKMNIPQHESEGRPCKDNKGNDMPWMVWGSIEIEGEEISSGVIAWCFDEEDAKDTCQKIREHYWQFDALCYLYIEGVETQLDGFSVSQKSTFPPGNAFLHDALQYGAKDRRHENWRAHHIDVCESQW